MSKLISIVIPAYNEEKTLETLVNKVTDLKFKDFEKEIIIVNDGSKDKTFEIMKKLESENPTIKAFENERNMGKTQTVKHGLLKSNGDYVVIQDADLEYEPLELIEILELAVSKNLDVVYGNRFGKKNKVIYWQNYIGNKALSFFSNIFTFPRIKVWLPDMEVCYKLVRGDVIRDIAKTIESKSTFGLEPEITAKLSKYRINGKNLKFGTMAISYYPRSINEGKKMKAFSDGFKALKEILKFNIF